MSRHVELALSSRVNEGCDVSIILSPRALRPCEAASAHSGYVRPPTTHGPDSGSSELEMRCLRPRQKWRGWIERGTILCDRELVWEEVFCWLGYESSVMVRTHGENVWRRLVKIMMKADVIGRSLSQTDVRVDEGCVECTEWQCRKVGGSGERQWVARSLGDWLGRTRQKLTGYVAEDGF